MVSVCRSARVYFLVAPIDKKRSSLMKQTIRVASDSTSGIQRFHYLHMHLFTVGHSTSNMFSKFVGLLRTFGGRLTVGKDKNGNTYFRKLENVGGGDEKRWVEFNGPPDPTTIPVEWTSWLSGTRKEAPTPQEIITMEAQRKNVKMRAALLKKEEEKERFRARVPQHGQNSGSSQEDMEIIMRQIDSGEFSLSKTGKDKAEEPQHARYTKVRDVKESAEPTTWQPNRRDTSGTSRATNDSSSERRTEPQSEGENFQPGTWKP